MAVRNFDVSRRRALDAKSYIQDISEASLCLFLFYLIVDVINE